MDQLGETKIQHIGIIMDGNGRWAKERSLPRSAGHYEGLKAAKRVTTEASRLGIPFLTYYVFSTENWKRPPKEVGYLMNLLSTRLYSELDFYTRIGAKVLFRGDVDHLSSEAIDAIEATKDATKDHSRITVILAINYGGQDEIIRAIQRYNSSPKTEELTTSSFSNYLDLPGIPPVDIIVRSGGEQRLSNFLLWDAAYAEFAFYDTLWPEWGASQLQQVCKLFQKRNRRFGGLDHE
ncbi:MAG: polyprenyl diphosphate synthase [Sphaerochaetaceae bacterium]